MEHFVRLDGGVGRVIAASGAVLKYMADKSGGVVSSISDVLENLGLPRVYPIGTPFLFEDKIKNGIYLEPEPYNQREYFGEEKPLSQVFNKLLNGVDEPIDPVIRLTENEKVMGKNFVDSNKKGKKFLLLQPYGSSGGGMAKCQCGDGCKEEMKLQVDESYRSFTYDFTDKLIEALSEEYSIFLVKLPHQKGHAKCLSFQKQEPIRHILSLIPHADAIVACDSFLHHAAKALNHKNVVVLWAGTNPKNLGYDDQKNIVTKKVVEYEPLRIPHNHIYYVDKNKGCNNFDDETIEEIKKKLKE